MKPDLSCLFMLYLYVTYLFAEVIVLLAIMSFLLRRTVICFPVAFNLESISGKVDPVVPHGCYVMAR